MLFILDFTGYIDRQSSNGNQYFDDKLKISSKEYQLVRFMKRGNYTITRRYLSDMLSCPVTMKSVTKTSGGVLFYNSWRGSSTGEARFMSFKYADSQNIIVKELKEKATGRFESIAAFKWIGQEKNVEVKKRKKGKMVLLYLSI